MARSSTAYKSKGRVFHPKAAGVWVLGVPGQLILNHPATQQLYVFEPEQGSLLCANDAKNEMYIIIPKDKMEIDENDLQLHVKNEDAWEEFTHRRFEGYFGAYCENFRKPQFRGEIHCIEYIQTKNLDEDSRDKEILYRHNFDVDNYPELWSVGHDQYFIPRGPWRITDRGITNLNE